jgi:hypothetical protein
LLKHLRRIFAVAAVVLAATTAPVLQAGAAPAGAAPATTAATPAGGFRPIIVSDTGYRPTTDFFVDALGACGTEIVGGLAPNTTNHRVIRTITFRNGDTFTMAKGTEYVRFIDANAPFDTINGVPVTLPISGTVTKLRLASGAVIVHRQGPSLLITSNDPVYLFTPEATAFKKAHLQNFSTFSSGALTEYRNAGGTSTTVLTKPTATRSICDRMGLGAFRNAPVLVDEQFESAGF